MIFTGMSDPLGVPADPQLLVQAAAFVLIVALVGAALSVLVPWYAVLSTRNPRATLRSLLLRHYPLILLVTIAAAASSLLFVETLYGAFFFDALRAFGTAPTWRAVGLIAAPILGGIAVIVAFTPRTERQLLWCSALILPLAACIIFLLTTVLRAFADPLFSINDLARHAQILPMIIAGVCALAAGAAIVMMGMMMGNHRKTT